MLFEICFYPDNSHNIIGGNTIETFQPLKEFFVFRYYSFSGFNGLRFEQAELLIKVTQFFLFLLAKLLFSPGLLSRSFVLDFFAGNFFCTGNRLVFDTSLFIL